MPGFLGRARTMHSPGCHQQTLPFPRCSSLTGLLGHISQAKRRDVLGRVAQVIAILGLDTLTNQAY